MKVRISGNSIRFRLKQSEVKSFGQKGEITEVLSFGFEEADRLSFVLKRSTSTDFVLSFQSNAVTVEVPLTICNRWTETTLVGFEETITTSKGNPVHILVEKDFKCLDGTDAENEDAFPNPNLHC